MSPKLLLKLNPNRRSIPIKLKLKYNVIDLLHSPAWGTDASYDQKDPIVHQMSLFLDQEALLIITYALVTLCVDYYNVFHLRLPLKTTWKLWLGQNATMWEIIGQYCYAHETVLVCTPYWLPPKKLLGASKMLTLIYKALHSTSPIIWGHIYLPWFLTALYNQDRDGMLQVPSIKHCHLGEFRTCASSSIEPAFWCSIPT